MDAVEEFNSRWALELFEKNHPEIMSSPERIVKANELLTLACNYIPFEELSPEQMTAALDKTAKATHDWFGIEEPKTPPRAKPQSATQQEERARQSTITEMRKARHQEA